MRIVNTLVLSTLWLTLAACNGDGKSPGNGNGKADSTCYAVSDCGDGLVCLAYGSSPGVCTPTCELNADACSANATCGGAGLVVDVCEPDDKRTKDGEVPSEDEVPRLPCDTDAECADVASDAICMNYRGHKDCTIPCEVESNCDLPSLGGITMDFLTCAEDESDPSRSGCVPDEACFANPMNCISFDFDPGF